MNVTEEDPPSPTGWPWPLDGVQAWFENLLSSVWRAAWSVASYIWDLLPEWVRKGLEFLGQLAQAAWQKLWTFIKDPVGSLMGLARAVWDILPDWIRGPINALRQIAESVLLRLIAFFKDPVGALKAGWDALTKSVGGFVDDLRTRIGSGLDSLSRSVSGFFTDLWGRISSGFEDAKLRITTALDGASKAIGGWVSDALKGVAEALGAGLQVFWDWLIKHLSWLAQMIIGAVNAVIAFIRGAITNLVRGFIDAITGAVTPGSPPQEVEVAVNVMVESVTTRTFDIIKEAYASPPGSPEVLASAVKLVGTLLTAKTVSEAAATAGDAAHPLKQLQLRAMVASLIESLGVGAMIGGVTMLPVTVGLVTPLRYWYQETFTPYVPREDTLTSLATERLLSVPEFYTNMRKQGFNEFWSDRMLQAAWRVPAYAELREMHWRGKVTKEGLTGALRFTGIREDFIPGYEELITRIPGPGDLITMVVREVITPDDFFSYMPMQGFYDPWPKYYWEMHWILLPLGEVRRARHRGLIDDSELAKFLVLHDYKPEPRPDIKTSDRDLAAKLIWDLPGRIDTRWLFRWGLIPVERIEELLIKDGMDPEWAPAVAEAYAKQQVATEINRLRDNIKADLSGGLTDEVTAKADLTELGYPPEWVEFHTADAVADRERSHKKKLLDYYEDAYLKDISTEPRFEDAVREILVVPEMADLFIEATYVRKYKKPPPVEDLSGRLVKARADYNVQLARVDRLREDVVEYEASMVETEQVYDARISAVEAELAVETRPAQIRKLEAQLTILRAQKDAKMTAMAATLTSKQRAVLEAEIRLDYVAEMVKLLEEKAAA